MRHSSEFMSNSGRTSSTGAVVSVMVVVVSAVAVVVAGVVFAVVVAVVAVVVAGVSLFPPQAVRDSSIARVRIVAVMFFIWVLLSVVEVVARRREDSFNYPFF